jgi:hypothetical protein
VVRVNRSQPFQASHHPCNAPEATQEAGHREQGNSATGRGDVTGSGDQRLKLRDSSDL